MRIVKASTTEGKRLIERAANFEGIYLQDVYGKCSKEKQKAWDDCFNKFRVLDGAHSFCICSHNSFQFSCSWIEADGSVRIETRDNSYLVVFDEEHKRLFDTF